MIAYQTDKTGVFVGAVYLDRDPLEQDKWLIPADAFTDAPPSALDKQFVRRNGKVWVVEDLPTEPVLLTPPTQAELDAAYVKRLDDINERVMDTDLALKAFALIVLDEINGLRTNAGLAERGAL